MDPVDEDDEIIPHDFEIMDPDDEVIPVKERLGSKIKRGLRQIPYGVNRALATPLEVIAPEFTEKYIKPTMYPDDPKDAIDRVGNAAGEALLATGTLGAGMTASAARYLPQLSRIPEALRPHIMRMLGTPWGSSAGGASTARMASDMAMGTAGGAGEQVYEETAEDPTTLGRMGSGFAGAMAVPIATGGLSTYAQYVSPTAWALKGGKLAGRAASHYFLPDEVKKDLIEKHPQLKPFLDDSERARQKALPKVAEEFKRLDDPEYQEAMAEADRLRQSIPNFEPTLGEASGLPSAITTQTALERRASGPTLDRLSARKTRSEDAVRQYADSNRPSGAPGDIEESLTKGLDAERGIYKAQGEALDDEAAKLTMEATPAPSVSGKALRDRYYEMKNVKSEEMSALADELLPPEYMFVPLTKLKKRLTDIIKPNAARASDFGATTADIMGYDPAVQGRPTFGDVKFWREKLGDEVEQALRAGKWSESRRLINVRNELDDFLEKDWAQSVPGLADRYKQFRDTYRSEYISKFEKDASRDIKLRDRDNDFRTDDEKVAKLYWNPGDVTSARQFKETFGDDPTARKALHGAIIDDFMKKAIPATGTELNPGSYARWMRANQHNLAEFPEIATLLKDKGKAIESIATRRAEVVQAQGEIDKDLLTKALGKGADAVIDAMLTNPRVADNAISMMGQREAQAAGRMLWDRVMTEKSPTEAKRFLNENIGLFKRLLTEDQLAALRDSNRALEMLARVERPKGQPTNADPFKKIKDVTGTGPLEASSRGLAVASGRTGWKYVGIDLMARLFTGVSRQDTEKLMTQAIYDPKFARELSDYVSSGKFKKQDMSPGLKAYITAITAKSMEPRGDDEEGPDRRLTARLDRMGG